jgi:cobalamin-dependent methionine synthase I
MVADFCELQGWHGFSLGANTPTADLLRMIRERDPDLVGLSVSLLFNVPQLETMLAAIRRGFPDLEVIIGGHAFAGDGAGREARETLMRCHDHVRYLASLDELEAYLHRE